MQSVSHKSWICGRLSTYSSAAFCAAASVIHDKPVRNPNQIDDIDSRSLGDYGRHNNTDTEVLWCLDTAVNHHLLNSNKGIVDMFKAMFPDSDISKSLGTSSDLD